jgi:hypothetical protein
MGAESGGRSDPFQILQFISFGGLHNEDLHIMIFAEYNLKDRGGLDGLRM